MKNVLIVEPDELVRDSVTMYLEDFGFRVDAAKTGKAAMEALKRGEYQMVICAHSLPDMDGLDFFRLLAKSYERLTKILEIAPDGEHNVLEKAFRMGVRKFFTKPITAQWLGELVFHNTRAKP